jgi:acyl transferase domain-containing protein
MSNESLSPVKQALLEIRELRASLSQLQAAQHEPIAIVGMALRAPGDVTDVDGFWELLRTGRDAISETPTDRWENGTLYDADSDAPGKVSTKFGGFLRDVDQFDADFFGVSRREAESMDPQQRMLLELTWEALERAGIAPDSLHGTDAGFFVGIANSDYWRALYANPAAIDVYAGMGGALSVASGRLAYVLGAHGPTMSIDTACSSSLVAMHLACQSLRRGETQLALAGGVSLILSPEGTINFSKARMMAPDGRCKTFDAAADGYVRSDGCAMLVLKRLSTANADGDRVLAVIRGTAINQDGRSNGLTAPSAIAQAAVIRAALDDAGLPPSAVQYVEAHGTGTPLGDPIELQALGAVYGASRDVTSALVVGSVKTNMGHLESAAGVIGVVKVVLALQHAHIPPHLHATQPTPLIDWQASRLRLPARGGEPWSATDAPRVAAVSSFGFSGTNAHVIIEQGAPLPAHDERAPAPMHMIPLTGRTPAAVRALARSYADRLTREPAASVCDVAYTASVARAQLKWARSAVVAPDAACAAALLRRIGDGLGVVTQPGNDARPRIAFLFTGQGAQFTGMGRDLYQTSAVVRDVMDACSATIERELSLSLSEILWGERSKELLGDTRYGQPAIVAVELALAALWRSWGVEPTVVAGHSLGEFAAAAFAGVISTDDAMRLVIARASLVDGLDADLGAMTVVSSSRERVEQLAGGFAMGGVELAADNGPAQVVLTGPVAQLTRVESALSAAGIEFRRLVGVRHAFHSAQLEPVLPAFARFAESIVMSPPQMAWVSGLTGALFSAGQAPPRDYWSRQTRGSVQFSTVSRELLRLGVSAFVEIGPHPILTAQVAEMFESMPRETTTTEPLMLPSLRRGSDGWPIVAESLAQLFCAGADIDWRAFTAPYAGARIALPTYPFERQRYWLRNGALSAAKPVVSASSRRWAAVKRQAKRQSEQSPIGVDVRGFAGHWALLSRLSTAMIVDVLRAGGVFTTVGESLSIADVCARAGVVESQHQLVARWLQRLVREGLLQMRGDQFISAAPLPALQPADLLADVTARLAGDAPLLEYVRNCVRLLPAVMTGKANALETLFPDGSFALAEALYTTATAAQYVNALAGASIAALAEHPPERRNARVLELGAGTGGTTAALIPQLAGSGTEYWFTDVSDTFLGRAHDRFGAMLTLRTAVFDADRSGAEQGIPTGAFDVVTAANALHAVRNLSNAIANVRAMLTPGGYLMLVETTTHHDWFDVSTGLIEGWQHFEDGLRNDVPLLTTEKWRAALLAGGFAEVVCFPEAGTIADEMGQHVIIARVADGLELPVTVDQTDGVAVRGDTSGASSNTAAAPVVSGAMLVRLLDAAPSERIGRLRAIIGDAVADVLRRGADEPLEPSARLMEHGVDSLMAVQLRGTLSRGLAIDPPLPATLIFEHPTIDAIAQHLADRLFPSPLASAATLPAAPSLPSPVSSIAASDVREMSDADIAALLEQRYGSANADGNS